MQRNGITADSRHFTFKIKMQTFFIFLQMTQSQYNLISYSRYSCEQLQFSKLWNTFIFNLQKFRAFENHIVFSHGRKSSPQIARFCLPFQFMWLIDGSIIFPEWNTSTPSAKKRKHSSIHAATKILSLKKDWTVWLDLVKPCLPSTREINMSEGRFATLSSLFHVVLLSSRLHPIDWRFT